MVGGPSGNGLRESPGPAQHLSQSRFGSVAAHVLGLTRGLPSGLRGAKEWADEMFAVFFSLLYLERIGEIAHADKNRIGLISGAQRISRQEMLAVTQGPLPDGFYGQAYLLGEELRQMVGWETLKDLATLRTAEGFPDVEAWIASLTTEVREKATRLVLGSAEL